MIAKIISRGLTLSLAALTMLSVSAGAAQARWLKASSALFVVYSDGKEDELKRFVGELHEYDAMMRMFTGTKTDLPPNQLSIFLVKQSQLDDAIPNVGRTVAGMYVSSPHGTQAIALREEVGGLPARAILMHEYAHHFMLQYHPAFYPAWYVEGFAEYFGSTEFKDESINVGTATPGRAWVLLNAPWTPIGKILAPADPERLPGTFYEQSWLTVNWFMSSPDLRQKFPKFLNALAAGEAPEKALIAATGMDFDALNSALKRYLKGRKLPGFKLTRDNKDRTEITIETLPDAEGEFLLDSARLTGDYDDAKDAAKYAPALRRRAAKHQDSAFALKTEAMAEIRANDFDNADKTLAKLEVLAPNDVNTPYLQALRYIADGRTRPMERAALWKTARSFATRAFRIDQNHYPSLYLYSIAAMGAQVDEGQPPNENTVNALLRAYELAPHVEEFRLESAIALQRAGKTKEARQLLLPLAYAPHSKSGAKSGAKFARKLIERMDAGEELAQALGDFDCRCDEDADANKKDAR
ncbi:MAG: tetratricopeptide repeat protein [Rhodospirillaceae bacterium]